MNEQSEQHEPLRLPLVAPVYTPVVRAGLRCVIVGLAQYVNQLPNESREKQLCFEALDGLVMRFQVGSVEDLRLEDHEIGELLHAFAGFLFTLYNLQPAHEKDRLRFFLSDWCRRIEKQVKPH
jgi:hypothetical protein